MNDERSMVIHFMDGSQMKLSFPKQVRMDETASARLESAFDKAALMVEADGGLMAIPFSSIKYIRSYPSPKVLPEYFIKGAHIEE